ncbi:hypothetical protein LTR56_009509 [Elasticomyces elasticus]|nr:hypothetical protein LTR22_021475 [Elasticomyces elasticus]KAK3644844.1 hypothetical protein LTR56_009509 [Elasticomyces elasticus]KAK4930972.1 hypothetical protein LTR49_002387 [Elasticomyces elasticus]KAK5742533.1 hypothetical protein LTS12_024206 [Elasticomyces elasticus]
MPPLPKTSVADSDEDDDEIIEPEVPQPSKQGGASMTQQSTGSTERMANEIRNAERDLLAPSADQAGSISHSSGQKRRSTAAVGDTPERLAKKSKVQGYGSSRPRSSTTKAAREQSVFDRVKDDDDAPATSHSARYSEHSGAVHSSLGLPDGTIKADFAAHEPNVMFGNTGSTAVDASSEQRRMVEQARSDARRVSTSVSKPIESEDASQKSSSFPWTISQQTPFAKTPAAVDDEERLMERRDPIPDPVQDADVVEEPTIPTLKEPLEADQEPTRDVIVEELPEKAADESAADLDGLITKAPLPPPRSSPRVEIARPTEDMVSPRDTVSETKRKPTRVRKPKVKEPSSEALNSDDRRIREELREDGLQKERYVPRPSRRRATQVAEVPIDFSVKPEKAAKAKRTKTTGGLKAGVDIAAPTFSSGSETPKVPAAVSPKTIDSEKHIIEPPEDPVKPTLSQRSPGRDVQQDAMLKEEAPAPLKSCMKSTLAPVENQDFVKPLPKQISTSQSPVKAPENDEVFVKSTLKANPSSSSPSKKLVDNDSFLKPIPKTKSTSRVKRSQTTIYEDHVDFSSQRTPTLSQQQAKRQAALQNISSDAVEAKANQKKRRTVVDEDEDVEPNEKVQSPAKEQQAPKLGLKPQTAPKKRRKIVEDDDEEFEQGAGAPAEQDDELQPATDMEVAPKKRGRGRPPKAAAAMEPMQDNEAGTDANKSPEEVEEAPKKPAKGRKSRKSTGPSVNTQLLDDPNNGMDMENIEMDETSKKPGRGRKASTPAVKPTEVETEHEKDEAPKTPHEPRTANEVVGSIRPAASGTQEPTPSPEKIAQAKAVTLPPKPSPTSHSPLKSSSTGPLRVGLNKRQRIPPLLRSIRPVKPR